MSSICVSSIVVFVRQEWASFRKSPGQRRPIGLVANYFGEFPFLCGRGVQHGPRKDRLALLAQSVAGRIAADEMALRPPMAPRHLTADLDTKPLLRTAAASVAVHLAVLGLLLLFTEVRSLQPVAPDSIAVELVTPEEIKPPAVEPPPQPSLPQPSPQSIEPPRPQQQQQSQNQSQPEPPTPAKPSPRPPAKPPAKQAAAPSPAAQAPQPMPQEQVAPPPIPSPPPPLTPQPPDITEQYQVSLGLPTTGAPDAGGEALERSKLAATDIDKLRAHLRNCSALPGGIAPTDKLRIVIRVWLSPEQKLSRPPTLVEASPSVKGPALMQAAIKALQDCQPYAMLPADKYPEWKVLDLGFTPQDFRS
jgi:hypothetical protein